MGRVVEVRDVCLEESMQFEDLLRRVQVNKIDRDIVLIQNVYLLAW